MTRSLYLLVFLSFYSSLVFSQTPPITNQFQQPLVDYTPNCNTFLSICNEGEIHLGEDAAVSGNNIGLPVYATADGLVRWADSRTGYGGLVIIEHQTPVEYVCSLYGHMLTSTLEVTTGQQVERGQLIGYLAEYAYNGNSTPHLHFGINKGLFADVAVCGGSAWRYGGYVTCTEMEGHWYDPADFLANHPTATEDLRFNDVGSYNGEWKYSDLSDEFATVYNQSALDGHPLGNSNDNGGSIFVHYWHGLEIQDFYGNNTGFDHGYTALIANPQSTAVHLLKEGFWDWYMRHEGWSVLGTPTSEEFTDGNGDTRQSFEHGYLVWYGGNDVRGYNNSDIQIIVDSVTFNNTTSTTYDVENSGSVVIATVAPSDPVTVPIVAGYHTVAARNTTTNNIDATFDIDGVGGASYDIAAFVNNTAPHTKVTSISSSNYTPAVNDNIDITFTLTNEGTETATLPEVYARGEGNGFQTQFELLANTNAVTLAAGQSKTYTVTATITGDFDHYVSILWSNGDPNHKITLADNPDGSIPLILNVGADPADPYVSDGPDVSPSPAIAGQNTSIQFYLGAGSQAVADAHVRVYVSDLTIGADPMVAEWTDVDIAANTTVLYVTDTFIPPVGEHTITISLVKNGIVNTIRETAFFAQEANPGNGVPAALFWYPDVSVHRGTPVNLRARINENSGGSSLTMAEVQLVLTDSLGNAREILNSWTDAQLPANSNWNDGLNNYYTFDTGGWYWIGIRYSQDGQTWIYPDPLVNPNQPPLPPNPCQFMVIDSTGISTHASLSQGLVSYWTLDEETGNRLDSHGPNDLTPQGATSDTGRIEMAADLVYANQQSLSISNNDQTGLGLIGDLTFAAWVNPASQPDDGPKVDRLMPIIGKDGAHASTGGYLLAYRSIYYIPQLSMAIGNGSDPYTEMNMAYVMDDAIWYHVVATYDADQGTGKIYVNGDSIGVSTTLETSIANTNIPFYIGYRGMGNSYWDGMIDEVGVWDRVLTTEDVAALYNNGLGLSYLPSDRTVVPPDTTVPDTTATVPDSLTLAQHATLTQGLVSYWTLDEATGTRLDAHGSNDLTDNNTVGQKAGKVRTAGDFERGGIEYLSIADAAQTGLDITGSMSMSAWINGESYATGGGDGNTIIAKSTGANSANCYLFRIYEGTGFSVMLYGDVNDQVTFTNMTWDSDTWYHVVCSWDAVQGNLVLYRDGVLIGTQPTIATILNNTSATFRVGARRSGLYDVFDGLIDEVGIWDRVLTAQEVSDLYNAGSGIPYSNDGLNKRGGEIEADDVAVPTVFALHQNYPNPFNPVTTIRFDVPEITQVTLTIYDVLGRVVTELERNEWYEPGAHKVQWNAAAYASGIYFYEIATTSGFVKTRKMIVLK